MAKRYLKPVYNQIYGKEFSGNSFAARMEMQKGVYLLQEIGFTVGDYDFMWYKHGPYSQKLQDDILTLGVEPEESINFTQEALKAMQKLGDILNMDVEYDRSEWAECMASLQYLKANVFSFDATDEEIIDELMRRKPHLKNRELNKSAINYLKELLS